MRSDPKLKTCPPRIGGFTLLEVIIALSLTSLLALLGAMLVRTATDHYARGNAFLDGQEQTRQIARVFTSLTAGLISDPSPIVGQPALLEMVSDRLPLSMNLPGRQKLRLQCEPNPEADGGLRLVLRVIDTTKPTQGTDAGTHAATTATVVEPPISVVSDKGERLKAIEVLGKDLKQCAFSYLRLDSANIGAPVGRWEAEWLESYGRSPLAIRLTIESPRFSTPPFVVALTP